MWRVVCGEWRFNKDFEKDLSLKLTKTRSVAPRCLRAATYPGARIVMGISEPVGEDPTDRTSPIFGAPYVANETGLLIDEFIISKYATAFRHWSTPHPVQVPAALDTRACYTKKRCRWLPLPLPFLLSSLSCPCPPFLSLLLSLSLSPPSWFCNLC